MARPELTRRAVLGGAAGMGLGTFAGCSDLLATEPAREPPVVDERPNAVYRPSHVEGMEMIGMADAGDRKIGLMYSYAHRFWTMDVGGTERVDPGDADVHLMASIWDPESGTVLPVRSGLTVEIENEGEEVDRRSPWTMLSQNMGFHHGDNFALDGDGTYAVTVETGGLSTSRLGEFTGRFEDPVTAEFEWEYSSAARDEIMFRELDDAGEPGAVEPMDMSMPLSFAPDEDDLPGQVVGSGESGDATFVATVEDRDDGDYLAISPRTPYNRYAVPQMALSATLTRDGETVYDDAITDAIGPATGYHYGAQVDAVEAGDELTISIDSPPQASRHEGYETAFLSMPDVTLTVERS